MLIAVAIGSVFRYPLVTDDPFITYRYSQNLIDGQGFVYNPGVHILSTTAPLNSLFLAMCGLLIHDLPTIGFWSSVLGLAVCAWFAFDICASLKMRAGGIVAALLTLVAPGLILTFGLETGLYLALAFGAIDLYLRGRITTAFALLALLTLTRNDGLVLATILGLDLLVRFLPRLRTAWRTSVTEVILPLAVYLMIVAPWLVFAWWWFGSPFPFTLTAKIAQAQSGLWDPFAIGILKWLRGWFSETWPIVLSALVGLTWALRSRSRVLLIAGWVISHLIAYSILGVAFYAWYVAPLIPATALFAGIGIEEVGRWLGTRVTARGTRQAFALFAALAMISFELRADLVAGMQEPSPKVQVYRRAAEWIAQNTSRDATVDALEVGVLGFYDGRPTLDFVGLVDPSRITYLRSREFADGVRRAAADYVIMIPPDVWLPQDPWFKAAYRPVQEFTEPGFYSGRPLVIYQRSDTDQAPVESISTNISFEKKADLIEVDLFSKSVSRGGILPVVLHLKASQALTKNYKFTLQLVGAKNRILAQSDTYYPIRLPEDGRPFLDHQGLPIKRDASTGSFDLMLAMYNADTGERSSLFNASGKEVGDYVSLGKIEIR